MMKFILDEILAAVGIILAAPVMLLVAVMIKLTSKGPVFFRQERIGKDFKPFSIYKFRSMVAAPPDDKKMITAANDDRITSIGRFLRKTKIDEIPQLINVLKGEMSLVGPRPEVRQYVDIYREKFADILSVRPGMTDIASITFLQEEKILEASESPEKAYREVILPEKMKLAHEYIQRKTCLFDLGLIVMTIFSILGFRNSDFLGLGVTSK